MRKGYRCEAGSEGSAEQMCELMTRTGYEARALDERATSREVHIHQGREA